MQTSLNQEPTQQVAQALLHSHQDMLIGQERFTAKGFIDLIELELCQKYNLASLSLSESTKEQLNHVALIAGMKSLHLEDWLHAYFNKTGTTSIELTA
ncbi:hypothetical protein N9R79_01390 [Vibrio sp.]|nr:hypothetical protein [Vibrio sp.]